MTRVVLISVIFGAIAVASLSLSVPVDNTLESNPDSGIGIGDVSDLSHKQIGIPTDALLRALENQFPQSDFQGTGRGGASLFNLSAYLNTNRPANTTALTFVPLITLLAGLLTG